MSNQIDRHTPTLAETVALLTKQDMAFRGVNVEAVRRDAADYYEDDVWRLGEFMVSRGTLTHDQLQLALAKQAEIAGDLEVACVHLKKLNENIRSRALCLVGELTAIFAMLSARLS